MAEKVALVTGSSGLIGSEAAAFLDARGWRVHGIDNNMRMDLLGPLGDTTPNLERLRGTTRRFEHHQLDIRDRAGVAELVASVRPQLVVHAAGQPAHEVSAKRPFDDFEINATGTLNLLEAVRVHSTDAVFAFLSTNKVYGDAPNDVPLEERETRWDYADPEMSEGIDESCRVDGTMHTLFGASKLAADVLVQEYGRYFGMPTVCFRAGCLTGRNHAGAELHGFLAYIARALQEGLTYSVFGYKGKQVRDNLHAFDVCSAVLAFAERPSSAAVYNLGGGRSNSISVLEAIERLEELAGAKLQHEYVEQARRGDHIVYISDTRRFRADYPEWEVSMSLDAILAELAAPPS
jgi:CDP-paratose 2-epimerase